MTNEPDTRIYASTPTGEHDVTEGVQALYDLLMSSMDIGSGFLSEDELVPVFQAAIAAGFDTSGLEDYLVSDAVDKRVGLWTGHNPMPPWRACDNTEYTDWYRRMDAARKGFQADEIAALRSTYGLE